jgi:hypothetical protein
MKVPWERKATGIEEVDSLETIVYEKLLENGYAMFDLQKIPHDDPVFLDTCARLMKGLEEHNWVVIVSNSKRLLRELGSVFPVIYAINNLGESVITLNGDELLDVIMVNSNDRDLDKKQVLRQSLIYIHDFMSKSKVLGTIETGVDSFLDGCISRKLIIDIYSEQANRNTALQNAFNKIEFVVSRGVASCLREESAAMHVYIEPKSYINNII